jgi:formylglycine-generating enzyme required for sulfatase activity
MPHDVFVSYSSKDKSVADTIVASLEKNNIRCWYAPRDVPPGKDWAKQIAGAVNDASIFLLIFSENANKSQRVLDELNLAINKEIIILPFRIEKLNPVGAMELHLSTRHWLDAFDPSWKYHLEKLNTSIVAILEGGDKELPELRKQSEKFIVRRKKRKKFFIFSIIGTVIIAFLAIIFVPKLLQSIQKSRETMVPTETFLQVLPSEKLLPSPSLTLTPSPTVTVSPSPSPLPSTHSTMTRKKDNMVMVFVPEGVFIMGLHEEEINWFLNQEWCNYCERDFFETTHPAHEVFLDAFWIDKYEVSNAQFAQCVEEGACSQPFQPYSFSRNEYYGNSQYDHYPVSSVSWYQANEYCHWAGGRLPTEAEWEKAARGTAGGYFPWGNKTPSSELANFEWAIGDTLRVGLYPEGISPYGALDMAGNVWEWVSDWWGYYDSNQADNPIGPTSGDYRVIRGGAWDSDTIRLLTAFRNGDSPEYAGFYVGFRCAKSP